MMRVAALCALCAVNSALFLDQIKLPKDFKIEVYAELFSPRSMDYSIDTNTLFVASYSFNGIAGLDGRNTRVYAVTKDADKPAVVKTLTEPIYMPNGIAYHKGNLYVAQTAELSVLTDVEKNLDSPPPLTKILGNATLPTRTWHGWRYIRVDPRTDTLYLAVGAPCNVPGDQDLDCADLLNGTTAGHPMFSTIQRMNLDGSDIRTFAHGIRNCVGMDFHPETGELWFTENGRDAWDPHHADRPPDELNHAPVEGSHFGFPFCYGGAIVDPTINFHGDCTWIPNYRGAAIDLDAHVAALGIRFYTKNEKAGAFPKDYWGDAFIAEHGSWNRQPPSGYQITRVLFDDNTQQPTTREPFATGWKFAEPIECGLDLPPCPGAAQCQNNTGRGYSAPFYCSAWGRPSDVQIIKDGSMLVSDELNSVIYRIYYDGPAPPWYDNTGALVGVVVGVAIIVGVLGFFGGKLWWQRKDRYLLADVVNTED